LIKLTFLSSRAGKKPVAIYHLATLSNTTAYAAGKKLIAKDYPNGLHYDYIALTLINVIDPKGLL